MRNKSRRLERRSADLVELLREFAHLRVDRVLDLSGLENEEDPDETVAGNGEEKEFLYLEGTGSLVLDRQNKLAFATVSPRCKKSALDKFSREAGYEVVSFSTRDPNPKNYTKGPTYHTNVVMSLGVGFAIICSAVIRDAYERVHVLEKIRATGREIIELEEEQMLNFSANCLQVKSQIGENLLVMSSSAKGALTKHQIGRIERYAKIVHAPLTWIEIAGGGSGRCILAEAHLPADKTM